MWTYFPMPGELVAPDGEVIVSGCSGRLPAGLYEIDGALISSHIADLQVRWIDGELRTLSIPRAAAIRVVASSDRDLTVTHV
jgi:hypothetical protein